MPKIKIVQTGWEGYTGYFGSVEFVDGVSVESVSQRSLDIIGSQVGVTAIADDGSDLGFIGLQDRMIGGVTSPALVLAPMLNPTEAELIAVKEAAAVVAADELTAKSKAELEAIADEGGIKGLRAIAGPLNVTGRSIPDLINAILAKHSELRLAAAVEVPVEIVVEGDADLLNVTGRSIPDLINAILAKHSELRLAAAVEVPVEIVVEGDADPLPVEEVETLPAEPVIESDEDEDFVFVDEEGVVSEPQGVTGSDVDESALVTAPEENVVLEAPVTLGGTES